MKLVNFGISEDCVENVFWRALNLPNIPFLKKLLSSVELILSLMTPHIISHNA